jgi:hypothetical protein
MEKEFIDLCLESAALHGYAGSSLKVWSNIIMALNSKYNQNVDQKILKNKWTSLRGGYMQWRELTHKTGHGYNADNGTFNWTKFGKLSYRQVIRFHFRSFLIF